MKKSEILHVIKEELDMVLEVKLRKGDFISQDDEIGVVNKIKGRVAYVKFPSTGAKSFDPVLVSDVKYKGKFKGKDLYLAEAVTCSSQSNRNEKELTEDHKGESRMSKSQLFKMASYSKKIHDMLKDDMNLPEWVESKITKAADYLGAVKHYLEYEMERGEKFNESTLKESREFVVIDPRGNARPVGSKIQASQYIKKMGGPRKGYHLVLKKNATKARRAIEKNGGNASSAKVQDIMFDLLYEGKLTESMIGIKTKANFKPNSLKGALERAGIKGFRMDRLTWSLTALKLDKKYYKEAMKIIDNLGLSIMTAKEGKINEATSLWKHFDAKMKLQDEIMDIEMDMKNITATIKQLHKNMEQEAEPEGGKVADKYGRQLDKYEKMYKKRKAEFKKLMAKLDKMEQF